MYQEIIDELTRRENAREVAYLQAVTHLHDNDTIGVDYLDFTMREAGHNVSDLERDIQHLQNGGRFAELDKSTQLPADDGLTEGPQSAAAAGFAAVD